MPALGCRRSAGSPDHTESGAILRNRGTRTALITAALAAALLAAGCSSSDEVVSGGSDDAVRMPAAEELTGGGMPERYTDGDDDAPDLGDDVEYDDADDEYEEYDNLGSDAPRGEGPAVALGDTATLGDWEITITEVEPDADAAMAEASSFGADPTHGYVLITYDATYNGTETDADAYDDLDWYLHTVAGDAYRESGVLTPHDVADVPLEPAPGETVSHQISFDVPAGSVEGGVVTFEEFANDAYVDFLIS